MVTFYAIDVSTMTIFRLLALATLLTGSFNFAYASNLTHKQIHLDWIDTSPHQSDENCQSSLVVSTLRRWPRPYRSADKDLFFAVLFHDDPTDELRHRVTISSAIDIAVQNVCADGGLLAGFNITTEYRDSYGSSTIGGLVAWDLHQKHHPGSCD